MFVKETYKNSKMTSRTLLESPLLGWTRSVSTSATVVLATAGIALSMLILSPTRRVFRLALLGRRKHKQELEDKTQENTPLPNSTIPETQGLENVAVPVAMSSVSGLSPKFEPAVPSSDMGDDIFYSILRQYREETTPVKRTTRNTEGRKSVGRRRKNERHSTNN